MSHEDVVRRTAVAIRLKCPPESECLADEEECFAKHPIHGAGSIDGVTDTVYADVIGLAEFIVGLYERGFFEDYK